MKMIAIIGMLLLVVSVSLSMADVHLHYGVPCTYTGDRATDDAACAGNLLCSHADKCDCPDHYPPTDGRTYVHVSDGLMCVPTQLGDVNLVAYAPFK